MDPRWGNLLLYAAKRWFKNSCDGSLNIVCIRKIEEDNGTYNRQDVNISGSGNMEDMDRCSESNEACSNW